MVVIHYNESFFFFYKVGDIMEINYLFMRAFFSKAKFLKTV